MIDKVVIDGVDVSKCRDFLKDTKGLDYNTDEFVKGCCEAKGCYIGSEFIGYSICRGDKDCYYKQLQRKEQECEELKSELELYKTWYRAKHGDVKNILKRYHKALEEIEGIVTKDHYDNNWADIAIKIDSIRSIINKVKEENEKN